MTPEEYLVQVKDIDLRIRSLEDELLLANREDDTEYAEQITDQIEHDISCYKKIKQKIRNEIQQVKDNRLSTLLMEYYVKGKSWEMVTEAIGMKSVKNVRENLHKKALKAFMAAHYEIFLKI